MPEGPFCQIGAHLYLEIITCNPLIYTIDHPKLMYKTRRNVPLMHIVLKYRLLQFSDGGRSYDVIRFWPEG